MDETMDVVTGAFSYTGKYITRRLLAMGRTVRTLTGHPGRANPFGPRVSVAALQFDDRTALAESLRGCTTLYNTYWVRFPRGQVTFDRAVENTRILIRAAEHAGVSRIVHVSITNPSEQSPFPYFRGKAIIEKAILDSKLPHHAILRPAVVFGAEDILINNIAWLLRRFPAFAVPGSGRYRLQPIFVEDLAELAAGHGQRDGRVLTDAVGPEVYSFNELVRLIAAVVGSRARILHLPPAVALFLSRLVGHVVGDVVLTRDEVDGLMADLLISSAVPTGKTRLSDWLRENAGSVGIQYASEVARHYR